jgi:molecular chaperone GrpE
LNQDTDVIEDLESDAVNDGPVTEEETLESLTAERDQLIDQLQRSVAEFQNYRRRVDQDRLRMREIASQDVIRAVLPLIDDLQRALASVPQDQRETGFGEGITAIERKFLAILERNGVAPVGRIGDKFDPAFHEAVSTDESGQQSHVVEVYQTGFKQGESVLRPAMVKVGGELVYNA